MALASSKRSTWICLDPEEQLERLLEAKATGAQTLVTACPKCQIHLNCALTNLELDFQIKDLTLVLAESIK